MGVHSLHAFHRSNPAKISAQMIFRPIAASEVGKKSLRFDEGDSRDGVIAPIAAGSGTSAG
ncbi:MAG: hypothetical protein ABIO94_03565, partial [Opitutaceae bacterium]